MVSCTDCAHYNACKVWAEYNEKMVYKRIDHINFPLVAETKEDLCENYEKAKENV